MKNRDLYAHLTANIGTNGVELPTGEKVWLYRKADENNLEPTVLFGTSRAENMSSRMTLNEFCQLIENSKMITFVHTDSDQQI